MERYMIFIPATGKCSLIQCDDGDSIKLETMQELVGGPAEETESFLEPSWAREPVECICLIVNEEGLLRQLPKNMSATNLYAYSGPIVGDAVLVAARGENLIGFPKPVCRTICDDWELEMEDGTWTD